MALETVLNPILNYPPLPPQQWHSHHGYSLAVQLRLMRRPSVHDRSTGLQKRSTVTKATKVAWTITLARIRRKWRWYEGETWTRPSDTCPKSHYSINVLSAGERRSTHVFTRHYAHVHLDDAKRKCLLCWVRPGRDGRKEPRGNARRWKRLRLNGKLGWDEQIFSRWKRPNSAQNYAC